MRYTKEQRTQKDRFAVGTYIVTIAREMQNTKAPAMHSLIIENGSGSMFWNVWLTQLEDVAIAAGVPIEADGSIDTSRFVGRNLRVVIGEKLTKDGRSFVTVTEYYPANETAMPVDNLVNF